MYVYINHIDMLFKLDRKKDVQFSIFYDECQ